VQQFVQQNVQHLAGSELGEGAVNENYAYKTNC
jgi:hypothetical protein